MVYRHSRFNIVLTNLHNLHSQPLKTGILASFIKIFYRNALKPNAHRLIKHLFRESVNIVKQKRSAKRANFVLRFSSLGDVVLCSAFVSKIKELRPSEPCIFVTRTQNAPIVSTFMTKSDRVWSTSQGSLSLFFASLWKLRELQKEEKLEEICVYDLHGVPKSLFFRIATRIFCLFNGIKYSSKKSPKKSFLRFLSVFFKKDLLPTRHIYLEHQKLLDKELVTPHLPALQSKKRTEELPLFQKKILIAPDSQHWKKKWPITQWEKFFELAKTELAPYQLTLVGGEHIFPQDLKDHLKESLGQQIDFRLGRLPLEDLSCLAALHHATVCSNSAWQHISEAVKVPVVSLAGPIVRGFGFSPFLKQSYELSVDLSCRPCTRHGGGKCLLKGEKFHACMKEIPPHVVIQKLKEILR
jgi:ADP-heptose:LPS heptosyltransferase